MPPARPVAHRAFIDNLARALGVDRAVAYTLIGRGWNVIAGPLTMVLVARFLRREEQGFYYTFGSVLALSVFFELGLTHVLLQFSSHEKAHLEWTPSGTLSGSEIARLRLAALLKQALRWYSVAAGLVLLLVLPAGLAFFSSNSTSNAGIAWRGPWLWLASISALNLFVAPLFSVLEGCGKIRQIAWMRAGQSMLGNLALWLTLVCRGGLFAGPVFETVRLAFGLAWLVAGHGRFFRALLQTDATQVSFDWWREVWPFQWRIALSWLSGYFMFQFFNPILFVSQGPVVAGQMGMSLSLSSALLGVSMAWMNTKASPFGVLAARREWKCLDAVFFLTFRQSLLALVAGGAAVYAAVLLLNSNDHPLARRILDPFPLGFLLLSTVLNHALSSEAQYLRAHKAEPFLWLSIIMALATGASALLVAKPFGAPGVSAAYLVCCSAGVIGGTKIFLHKRRTWHAAESHRAAAAIGLVAQPGEDPSAA